MRKIWEKIEISVHNKRITDILEKDGQLLVLTRDFLLRLKDNKNFEVISLPKPENYDNKIGLFKTLWVIHSGEIYGETGKLIVDAVGLIFIFLTVTGLIYFINTYIILRKKKKNIDSLKRTNKWNLKWHNKIGWITLIFLTITTITGMFLRPPLLIAVANLKVSKIPYTELKIHEHKPIWEQLVKQVGLRQLPTVFIKESDTDTGPVYISGRDFNSRDEIIKIIKKNI